MNSFKIGATEVFIEPTQISTVADQSGSHGHEEIRLVQPSAMTAESVRSALHAAQADAFQIVTSLAKEFDKKMQETLSGTRIKEVTVEFALSVSTEASVWFLKSTGEGTFTASLKWERTG